MSQPGTNTDVTTAANAGDQQVLPAMDVAGRLARLRGGFDAAGIDALLVTRLPNVAYLTGFTGSAATVLVTTTDAVLLTDGRYRDQSGEQLADAGVDARVVIGASQADQDKALRTAVGDADVGRLGLEAHGITWSRQRSLAEGFTDLELVPTTALVEALRKAKDAGEIARIEAACDIADAALAGLIGTLADGPTEREFAIALEFAMRARGAVANSFDPIVASGRNGAKPHARPSSRHIERGELIVIDFGCIVDGYCSDMTRTVSVGDPGAEARRVWDVVIESQAAGCEAVRAGADCAAVDQVCRAIITDAGWGDAFIHGTGHGVGIEIHEDPRVASTSSDTLAVGEIVTVEPGIYLTGIGGVRIEDTLVVTGDGNSTRDDPVTEADQLDRASSSLPGARSLTKFPKELV